jgi:hypothetical protein
MLYWPLLGGFRIYHFLLTYVGSWYLKMCGTYDASLLNEFFDSIMIEIMGGCMVVGRKVEFTRQNG